MSTQLQKNLQIIKETRFNYFDTDLIKKSYKRALTYSPDYENVNYYIKHVFDIENSSEMGMTRYFDYAKDREVFESLEKYYIREMRKNKAVYI